MPFNMFPYADLANLNLDWLMQTMKTAADLSKDAEARVKAIEYLVNVPAVRQIVRDILQDMSDSGDLGADLLAAFADIRAFNTSDNSWGVLRVFDRLVMDKRFYSAAGYNMQDYTSTLPGYTATDVFTIPLDMPMDRNHSSANISADSYGLTARNVSINGTGTQLSFRLVTNSTAVNVGDNIKPAFYASVNGRHRELPETPQHASRSSAEKAEIINVCDSYLAQAALQWGYGANFVTYGGGNTTVRNSAGDLMMECDTLVALVFLGLLFSDTPYSTAATNYNFSNLPTNPNSYSWVLPWASDPVLGRKVTWTGGINWWLWDNDAVFSSRTAVEDGDIVVFTKPEQYRYFDNISHIGICKKVSGVIWVYHFTGSGLVPGSHMQYEQLDAIMARESYGADDVYFARPVASP